MLLNTLAIIIVCLNAACTADANGPISIEQRSPAHRSLNAVPFLWKGVTSEDVKSLSSGSPRLPNRGSTQLTSTELCYTYSIPNTSQPSALILSCHTSLRGGASELTAAPEDATRGTSSDAHIDNNGADVDVAVEDELDADEEDAMSSNASTGTPDSGADLPSSSGSVGEGGPAVGSPESADETCNTGADVHVPLPTESLKRIWRDMIRPPPSSAELELILLGKRAGYKVPHGDLVPAAVHPGDPANTSDSKTTAVSATAAGATTGINVLRANGTDHESLYRQVLSQFLSPLSSDGRRALWLDQEFALNLKGSVVLAHQPELWQGIGEGLKPKLTRGIRLVTPASEVNNQGPMGLAPVHDVIATALSHSVGANTVYLNLRAVERVRDRALSEAGVPRGVLSKANILSALLDACEEAFVETGHPAVVVINDHPSWLLSNEAAAEVVLEELKSVSSRVMFIAACPEDALQPGDYAPSARPPAPVPTAAAADTDAPISDGSNPFSTFANFFQGSNSGNSNNARTGTGTFGKPIFPSTLPPSILSGLLPPSMQQGNTGMQPPTTPQQQQQQGGMPFPPGMLPPQGALVGRSFQVIVRNGTATMIPLQSTVVTGPFNGPPGMPPQLPEAVLRRILEEQQRSLGQQQRPQGGNGDTNGSTADASTGGNPFPGQPQQSPIAGFPPGGVSFPLFPPDMSQDEIQEFMQDPDNQAKIKQTLDSVVQSFSQQMAEQFGRQMSDSLNQNMADQHQRSGQPGPAPSVEVKVQMIPLPPGVSPPFPFGAQPSTPGAAPRPPGAPAGQQNNAPRSDRPSSRAGGGPGPRLPGPFFAGKRRGPTDASTGKSAAKTGTGFPPRPPLRAHSRPHSRPHLHTPSPAATSTATDDDTSNLPNGAYAPSGVEIVTLFEDAVMQAPRDVNLRMLWDRILDEHASGRILKANRRLIHSEMKRNRLKHSPGAMRPLDPVLRRQVMSREEVQQALRTALKLQAGKHTRLSPAAPGSVVPESGRDKQESGSSDVGLSTDSADGSTAPTGSAKASGQIVLTQWALDTAFSAALRVPTPRLGRPAARSKEEITALVTDKHEKSLIGNVISPQDIGVSYDMIGGLDEVKELLRQCITYPLKYPRLYQEGVAAEAVKGVLLFGPPGTGKTMLAKAVATEGGATFLTIDTSTIENKWLGESEKNARAVFALARRLAPCVIYLDEVDSILSSREQGDESSHGTLTSVKTTLMQEWDGLRTTKDRVVVIASTNRPFDLDEAVLRRLPRRILVDLPDLKTRQEILQVTLAGNRVHGGVNFTTLAERLEGYTGSDIKEVCREAVVRVAHERAQMLEHGGDLSGSSARASSSAAKVAAGAEKSNGAAVQEESDFNAPLRAVTMEDFQAAMKKLKASVNDNGRELQKVVEWNNKYGEFKRKGSKASSTAQMTMYV